MSQRLLPKVVGCPKTIRVAVMKYNSEIHRRRSIRLKKYHYFQQGAYFVTICTQNHECLFGEIVDGKMRLNDAGNVIRNVWDGLTIRFEFLELDEFIVMPNHIHGIIVITRTGKPCVRPCRFTTETSANTALHAVLPPAPHLER